MANIRVKDLPNTDTLVDGDELIVDSSSAGTRRISFGELKSETASDFVSAPSTYKLATLAADNKLDPSQIPDTLTNGLNFVGVANSAPDLASTTQGDFYVIGTAFGVYSVGDQAVYDGSAYVRVTDGTKQIGEGGTGATTAAGARTNLSVNSKDEDAEATGTKLVGPALYFRGAGPNDFIEVAYDDKFSFTDGTNPTGFSLGGWVNLDSAWSADGDIVSKDDNTDREWRLGFDENGANDSLRVILFDSGGSTNYSTYTALVGGDLLPGQWQHIFFTYDPDTGDGVFYQNGKALSTSKADTGTGFSNFSNTNATVRIGRGGSSAYFKGHIRDVKIFNRELSATEVAQLHRAGDLGFSDEFGGANGGVYSSDFTGDSTDSWNASNGALDATVTIGGDSDNLQLTVDSTSAVHNISRSIGTISGKRYRVSLDYYVPSGQSNVDGFHVRCGSNGSIYSEVNTATTDAWTNYTFESLWDGTNILIYATDGGTRVFQDSSGDDVLYIRNIKITQLGKIASFSAERFDSSTGKLYDLSDNGFIGTNSGATLTGREIPVYETGTWTPSITFGGGSTGVTYGLQEGYYTRIGNQVTAYGTVTLTAKGSSTGNAILTGLPFRARNTTGFPTSFTVSGYNMASLQSPITGIIHENATLILLYDTGATGNSAIDETNFTDTTFLRFSVTYQIQ